jgi:hypothetical protein
VAEFISAEGVFAIGGRFLETPDAAGEKCPTKNPPENAPSNSTTATTMIRVTFKALFTRYSLGE